MPTRAGRVLPVAGLAAAAAGLVAVGAVTWRGLGRPAASADVTPAEARAAAWRAAGLTPQGTAEAHVASGREALAADLPERDAEALRHFMEALALEPSRLEAVAGWLTAFAASAGEDPDGDELREAHRLATWALARAPDRPDLLAGWARILLAAPGARNASEALAAAAKAVERGGGADALLALAQARLGSDPRGSADAAERALAAAPEDRRPLLAGARALWRAGEARAALERVERRLAIDRGHGGALALEGAILAAAGRVDAARAVLRRWVAAAPRSAEPLLAAGMLAAQVDGDLPEARR
ncbi:MAG TPA: hypothetical protein VH880_00380, partial [Anaeromyxobacteraceae bacterium]